MDLVLWPDVASSIRSFSAALSLSRFIGAPDGLRITDIFSVDMKLS